MEQTVSKLCKLSHKQFRALLKKFRRKKRRQQLAKEREHQKLLEQQRRESSPGFKEREEELRRNIAIYEEFEERERLRKHKLWLLREQQAQEEFKRKQIQLEQEQVRREEERKRILEEFEKQQYVVNKAAEEGQKIKSQKEEVLQAALSNLSEDGPWHNPMAPENYNPGIERDQCMFFSKTGCCRFGERCSRGHTRPDISRTILIRGMYNHFSMGQTATDDYDTDIALEYEEGECYQHFKNFYSDVLPEFKKFGKVVQFKVCSNFEPHLRGNVYIQYESDQEAIEAYKNFNGRYYAGKQLTCEFTVVTRWKAAICGLFRRKECPKGINCNFLHVFRNPNDDFWEADRDLQPRDFNHGSNSSRNRDSKHGYHSRYEHGSRNRESRSERYESRSDRHESRSERHESRSDSYESRSERHEHRRDSYESRSERHESRGYRYEPRSDRHDYRRDEYESRSERRESRSDRYEAKDDRYESSRYRDYSSTDSKSEFSQESDSEGNGSSKYHRRQKSRSKSRSPLPLQNGSKSRKKKQKKKKSKKSRRHSSSDSDS